MKGMAGNAVWHICSVLKIDSQELLLQKGCVIWKRPNGAQWFRFADLLSLHLIDKVCVFDKCAFSDQD